MCGKRTIVIKGAGEVASGVAYYLFSKGERIIMTEIPNPTTQRRTVAFAEAVFSEEIDIMDVKGRRVETLKEVKDTLSKKTIPVIVDPEAKIVEEIKPEIVIDGRMAKRNLGTNINEAELVIGLGPGFTAGADVNIAIETLEGPNTGKIIREGKAQPYTGKPCQIRGFTEKRVFRAPTKGLFRAYKKIGESIEKGETIGRVEEKKVKAEISGTIRGIIKDGLKVDKNQKLGDIDPRDLKEFSISDRSIAIGKGVWKAIKESFED